MMLSVQARREKLQQLKQHHGTLEDQPVNANVVVRFSRSKKEQAKKAKKDHLLEFAANMGLWTYHL